jgi:RNase H-like protein
MPTGDDRALDGVRMLARSTLGSAHMHPSGAAPVECFTQWTLERDPAVKQRILDYNQDDFRATRGIRSYSIVRPSRTRYDIRMVAMYTRRAISGALRLES